MRYFIELYARNIINVDEVDNYISSINHRDEKILKWLKKKARKYIIEEFNANQITYDESMPDWAKNGDVFEVVLTEDLTRQINDIVDYLNNVLLETPDFDIQLIRWDEAIENSKEFHNELVKISKDNVNKSHSSLGKIYHKFENGFFWTELLAEDAEEETELMGNCVKSYYGAINDGDVSIFSLRDSKNRPHIDIECNPKIDRIFQIEGKSAAPIAKRYLEYVKWFVYHKEFETINFDDAKALKPEYEKIQKEKLRKFIEEQKRKVLEDIKNINNSDIVFSNEFGIIIGRNKKEISYLKAANLVESWRERIDNLYLLISDDIIYILQSGSEYSIVSFENKINENDSSLILSFFQKNIVTNIRGIEKLNIDDYINKKFDSIYNNQNIVFSNENGNIISRDFFDVFYLKAKKLIPVWSENPDNLYLVVSESIIYILQYKTKYIISSFEKKINEKDSSLILSFLKERKVNKIVGIEKLTTTEDPFQVKEQKVNDPFKDFEINKKAMVSAKSDLDLKLSSYNDLIDEINSLNGIDDIIKIKKLLKGKFPTPKYTYSGKLFLYFLTFLNDKDVICELLSTNNLYVKGLVNIFCDSLPNPNSRSSIQIPVRYRMNREAIIVIIHKRLIIRNRFISLHLSKDDFSLKAKNTMGANRNKFFTLLEKSKQIKH